MLRLWLKQKFTSELFWSRFLFFDFIFVLAADSHPCKFKKCHKSQTLSTTVPIRQGCQTNFPRGPHWPHGCLQRPECNFRTVHMSLTPLLQILVKDLVPLFFSHNACRKKRAVRRLNYIRYFSSFKRLENSFLNIEELYPDLFQCKYCSE